MADIDVVTCRQEGSAGFMALADAKLTRRAGVCLVSRGPGATNAAIAVHAAAEDATPLVLFVGGVATDEIDREVFQELDCGRVFGAVAKAVWTLHDATAAGELVARAFRVAESGTPGPVVVTLPEDVLDRPDRSGRSTRRVVLGDSAPCGAELDRVRGLLAGSRRPLLLAGARLDTRSGRALLREVAQRHHLPVVTSNKNQHLLPNRHPNYAGHLHNATSPQRLELFGAADLVLAVGTRLDAVTTKEHRFPASPEPAQPLVHVYPDAARIGRYHAPYAGFAADPVEFLRQLAGWAPPAAPTPRVEWVTRLHEREADNAAWDPVRADDGVVFGSVVSMLDELTDGDVTVVVDSGTFTSWVYRHLRFGERGRLLGISSSAMGFSVGAGVSAALRLDGAPTVVFVGDGGFGMNGGELITACERRLPVVFVIANNRSYGTIRLHQERAFPGRVIATDLANPDFARLAEAYGALGLSVHSDDQVGPCLVKALDFRGPAVLDVRTSLEHITAYRRLAPDA